MSEPEKSTVQKKGRLGYYIAIALISILILVIVFGVLPLAAMTSSDAKQHQTDHDLIIKLNTTVTNLSNFLTTTQLPFDCKLAKVNDTFQHCVIVMQGGR
jgi:hypothetical protein